MSSPEEGVRRFAKAAEAQDTEGTEAVAVQADEAVEEQGTEAGTTVKVEAGISFETIKGGQGILALSSTKSEEQGNPVLQPEPTQEPNVPQPEQEPPNQPAVPQPEPSPVALMQPKTPKMSKPKGDTAPEPEPFMPKVPKMGQVVQVSETTYVAELGNVPNPELTGLLAEGHGQYASTEQQRSMLAKYDNPKR
jgi:hypothetical protein